MADSRELAEKAFSLLQNALQDSEARAAELDAFRGRNVVVHCHHGGRSMRVAQWLRQQGFDHAQSMAGGIDQWAAEVEPGMTR